MVLGGKISNNIETASQKTETVKISTLEDLKYELGNEIEIPKEIEKIERPITVSKNEILELRKNILEKGNNETLTLIKGFLEKKIQKVFDSTKKTIEAFKNGGRKEERQERNKNSIENEKQTDADFEKAYNKAKKESQGDTNTQEALKKVKEVSVKGTEKVQDIASRFSWEALEKIPIIGWFFKIIGSLFGKLKSLFNFGEKVSEKLSQDEMKKTKQEVSKKIKTDILAKFENIHPLLKQKLEKKVEDPNLISEEKILKLKEISDKNGKLEIRDIKYVMGEEEYKEIGDSLKNDPEVWESIKLKYENQLVNAISREYGIQLEGDRKAKLKKLIQEKGVTEKMDFLQFYNRIENGETITLGELTVSLFDEAIEATWFMMSLGTKGIVSMDKFIFNIVEGGTKLAFGLAGYGITHLDITDFTGSLEKMNERERILVLGLLYRKGGILFELLGHISSFTATQMIESVSSTSVSKWELLKSTGPNIDKKIKTFEKLEKILGGKGGMKILNGALENQKLINRNNKIIKILKDVESIKNIDEAQKVKKIKDLLRINKFSIDEIKHLESIDEIRSTLSRVVKTNKFTTWDHVKGYLLKDMKARQIEFYRNIDHITTYQSRVIAGEKGIFRGASKIKEVLNSLQIGKNAERVVLEAKTAKGVITKLEALKKLSLEAPDLCRAIFKGFPEIAVLGLAAGTREENKSIMEAMIEVSPYLTRIIGPGMMIFSLGAAYRDGKVEWINVAEAGLGTVFLGIDAVAAAKIFGEHGVSGKTAIEIGKFIAKPLTAPLDIAVKGGNMVRSFGQLAKAQGSYGQAFKEIGKKLTKSWKNTGNIKRTAIVIGFLGLGYGIKEIFDEDFDDKYEELVEEGIIDPKTGEVLDSNKAKEAFSHFTNEEKQTFVEILFMTHKSGLTYASYLQFEVQNNNLLVTTDKNKSIGDWVITPEIKVELQEIGIKNITFKNHTPDNIENLK